MLKHVLIALGCGLMIFGILSFKQFTAHHEINWMDNIGISSALSVVYIVSVWLTGSKTET